MVRNCYATQSKLYNNLNSYCDISSVSTKTTSQMKSLSNLPGFSSEIWAVSSSINNGYPHLTALAGR